MLPSTQTRRHFMSIGVGAAISLTTRQLLAAPNRPRGKIAFVRGNFIDSDDRKIWLINPDGTDLQPLTQNTDMPGEDRPAWSPNGKQLAFSIRERIAVSDARGKQITFLTPATMEAGAPCWSPDAKHIAFYVWHDDRKSSHIYSMRTDGTEIKQLTNGSDYNWLPSWSSDNSHVIFESERDGNRDIYSMSPDGKDEVNLTHLKSTDHCPACSPRSTRIALMSGRDSGNAEICVMDCDGSKLTNLTKNDARDSEPAWSSDGQWLAFVRSDPSQDNTPMNIYIMKADGTQVSSVTQSKGELHNWAPSWY